MTNSPSTSNYENIQRIVNTDVFELERAGRSYGDSWKKRGGVGAYMMLARKWDRIEERVKLHGFDIFEAIDKDKRLESMWNDIRDLRRYLLLVEDEMLGVLSSREEQKSRRDMTPLDQRQTDMGGGIDGESLLCADSSSACACVCASPVDEAEEPTVHGRMME